MRSESNLMLDKFYSRFKPTIRNTVWGQGEYGYELIVFSSHEKEEVEKALEFFKNLDKNRYYVI